MALTPNYATLTIHADASITDVVAFHEDLRDLEASDVGMLYPTIHTYKQLPLGGGGVFPAVEFVNGWTLEFPAGNWEVRGGNVTATINPVAGAFVDRTQAAAYAVSSSLGSGGPSAGDVAAAVWAAVPDWLRRVPALLHADSVVDSTVHGSSGTTTARLRQFASAAAAAAATDGAANGADGEIARWAVVTEYDGAGQVKTHRLLREL